MMDKLPKIKGLRRQNGTEEVPSTYPMASVVKSHGLICVPQGRRVVSEQCSRIWCLRIQQEKEYVCRTGRRKD